MTIDPVVAWIIGFVVAGAVAAALWLATRATFTQPLFARQNYRGVDVPVGVGVLIGVTVIVVAGIWQVGVTLSSSFAIESFSVILVVAIACGFGLLGLFDDVAAIGSDRGFRGHLRAMADRRLTTGGLKLVVGGLFSLALAGVSIPNVNVGRLVLGGAVIALAANLGNLFDRAPGRCVKVSLIAGIVLLATCGAAEREVLFGVVVVLGAGVGLGVFDLREELMLGDAGSNVLGATLGWGLVATSGDVAQIVALVVLLALNAASEKVSFSAVINRVGPLRFLDMLGRTSRPS